MKRILLMAVAAFVITSTSHAQVEKSKDTTQKVMRHKAPRQEYARLNLNQAQKDQLQKIRQENMQERKAIRSDASLTEQQKADKMKALSKSEAEKRNSILTSEQKQKIKVSQKDRKTENRKAGMKGNKSKMQKVKRPSGMNSLSLTDAQKDQMQSIRKENIEQRKAIQNDGSLTREQKAAKMKALNQSQNEKMNSIFTPEQLDKMKNTRKDRQAGPKKTDGKKQGKYSSKNADQKSS